MAELDIESIELYLSSQPSLLAFHAFEARCIQSDVYQRKQDIQWLFRFVYNVSYLRIDYVYYLVTMLKMSWFPERRFPISE